MGNLSYSIRKRQKWEEVCNKLLKLARSISPAVKRMSVILLVSTVLLAFTGLAVFGIHSVYTFGQLNACNAMLRNGLDTKTYGLYCEQTSDGIVVKSTVLKKSLFNVTTGETL